MAVVKKKTKKTPKRGKFMENITSLYKDNTNEEYLNYLKPSQVSFLGSEH